VTLQASKLFAFGSARLQAPQAELDRFAQALKDNPDISNVVITGHTDRLGSKAANDRLSKQRADSVKSYLVAQGVAASRITTRGAGSADPKVTCTDKNQKALIACLEPNRRVEIEPITVPRR
jgi:OmpA-OmpF porin, OOP family